MAIAVVAPLPAQRVIEVASRRRLVTGEEGHGVEKFGIKVPPMSSQPDATDPKTA